MQRVTVTLTHYHTRYRTFSLRFAWFWVICNTVYTFWCYTCIKQTEMQTKHTFTAILNIISHVLSNIKMLGKEFVDKYNIDKCLQFNKADFKT